MKLKRLIKKFQKDYFSEEAKEKEDRRTKHRGGEGRKEGGGDDRIKKENEATEPRDYEYFILSMYFAQARRHLKRIKKEVL